MTWSVICRACQLSYPIPLSIVPLEISHIPWVDADMYIVEPNVQEHKVFKLTHYKVAYQNADIVVLLVAHNEFKTLAFSKNQLVLDFCGVTNNGRG